MLRSAFADRISAFPGQALADYFSSRPAIFEFLFWANCFMLLMILLTLFYLLMVRVRYHLQSGRRQSSEKLWQPMLDAAEQNLSYQAPRLRRAHTADFLDLWIERRQYCSAEVGSRLDALAFEIGLDRKIVGILRPSNFGLLPQKIWLKNLAITTARWLDTPTVRRLVLEVSESNLQFLAVQACACLIQLRVKGWQRAVVKVLFRFPAETTYFAQQVSEAGGAEVLKTLAPFLNKLPTHTVMNFIMLAEQSHDKSLVTLLENLLRRSQRDREKAVLLRTIGNMGDSRQRPLIIDHLQDPNIFVQIQALRAIASVGKLKDIELLIPHLSHSEWWVRYRAAQALLELCGEHTEIFDKIRVGIEDKFARDILNHAAAENAWCLT